MRLTYHPHARKELLEAAQYYESRVSGLGVRFLDEADRAVAIILEAPSRWRVMERGVRRYLMSQFPYAIYYSNYPDAFTFSRSNTTAGSQIILRSRFVR